MIENHLTKKDGALVGFRTQQFSLKKENNFNSVPSIERDLILDFVKKCISDLEITLQQNYVFLNYLNFQLSLKNLDNSLSLSVTRNLNGTSNRDSVSNNLAESFHIKLSCNIKACLT